jgi:flagellar protein FliL
MPPAPANPPKSALEPAAEKTPSPAATPGRASGLQPWLPTLVNLLLMPALAYATVHFLIIPKMRAGTVNVAAAEAVPGVAEDKAAAVNGKDGGTKKKTTIPLGAKVLVNVAGTMGTRYLMASLTLVSNNPDLKALVDKNDPQLRDAAASTLSVKTISDLEKPGARNLIRTELISVFNNILGDGAVSDIYLTEFAIQ